MQQFLVYTSLLLGLLFNSNYGGDIVLRNISSDNSFQNQSLITETL
jgi:hypothetical protein